jgi:hypothetical protein
MRYADINPGLYEEMRVLVKREVTPLLESYLVKREKITERRQKRNLLYYVVGTIVFIELLEAVLSKGKSLAPPALIISLLVSGFIGLTVYLIVRYMDDLYLAWIRNRLATCFRGLDRRLVTDNEFDLRKRLMENDVLKGEAVEIIAQYSEPSDFWADYMKARQADPFTHEELRKLNLPAFEKFLKYHASGDVSIFSMQFRFNRLFIEANEIFISKDRQHYVPNMLRSLQKEKR